MSLPNPAQLAVVYDPSYEWKAALEAHATEDSFGRTGASWRFQTFFPRYYEKWVLINPVAVELIRKVISAVELDGLWFV